MSKDTVSKDGTDGLETLGFVHPTFVTERERGYDEIFRTVRVPENWEPVVTRSQAESEIRKVRKDAEKLLAAERAEKEIAERNRDAARENFLTMQKSAAKLLERAEKAEADNAAKDARINFLERVAKDQETQITAQEVLEAKLETYHEEYENRKEGYEKTIDSLEEKLAAAEKALETEKILADRLASALEYIDDYSLSYPDLGTVTAVAQPALEAHSAARAVLGGKPS